MKKSEILKLLESEGWTKADALRAIASIDLSTDPDELSIRRSISSQFIGSELSQRQRLQSSQKRLVTIKNGQIKLLQQQLSQQVKGADNSKQAEKVDRLQQQVQQQKDRADGLVKQVEELNTNNQLFVKVNAELKQDNKHLKNLVDAIRLQIVKDMRGLLRYQDSELRQAIMKLYKSVHS
jgi:serine phosphatase RsbU (regulator of sigma subunit)